MRIPLAACCLLPLLGRPSCALPEVWPRPARATIGETLLHLAPGGLPWRPIHPTGGDDLVAGRAGSALLRAIDRCDAARPAPLAEHAQQLPSRPPSFALALPSFSEELTGPADLDESYHLVVNETGVTLSANTVWGARHGLDTLSQLFTAAGVHHADIADSPQYGYRGLMISPGQRFMTPALLKTHLDGMEIARMNVLHFHLSEFCRFAIESEAFPELSANLSSGLNRGFYSRPTPGPPTHTPLTRLTPLTPARAAAQEKRSRRWFHRRRTEASASFRSTTCRAIRAGTWA